MLRQAFICETLFRATDAQPGATRSSLFGFDAILTGHLAQVTLFPGVYDWPLHGQGLMPAEEDSTPPPPSFESFVQDALLDEFEDVALLLGTHYVEEGDKSWSAQVGAVPAGRQQVPAGDKPHC